MNTSSQALADMHARPDVAATKDIPFARAFYWSVKRELWENRLIYLAPVAVAGVFLFGFLIGLIGLAGRIRAAMAMPQHQSIEQPFFSVALVIMFTEVVVAITYCVDALYGERRDRSVLFWKSLPVSDLTTVLAKAAVPIVVLPLVAFALTAVSQFVMLVTSSAVLAAAGMDRGLVWTHVPFIQTSLMNFMHLVLVHGIWYAPLYAWLLLVSAWAKRVPLLWAVLPPAGVGIVEKMALNTSSFGEMLRDRIAGPSSGAATHGMNMGALAPSMSNFVTAPGLWIGLAATALFLYGAVRLRRARGLS